MTPCTWMIGRGDLDHATWETMIRQHMLELRPAEREDVALGRERVRSLRDPQPRQASERGLIELIEAEPLEKLSLFRSDRHHTEQVASTRTTCNPSAQESSKT